MTILSLATPVSSASITALSRMARLIGSYLSYLICLLAYAALVGDRYVACVNTLPARVTS